jgi:UDP-N-acetylmuramate dehydrogenase
MTNLPPTQQRTLLDALSRSDIGPVRFAAPLSEQTTWRIGGPADLLVEPERIEQVARVIGFARRHALPLVVIGQGSNLLFDDAGVHGIVLKIGDRLARVAIDGDRILAEGGAWVPGLAFRAMRAGLAGLEHIIGIPGTLGGLVIMNGGSQRKGIGENVHRVWIVDRDGEQAVLNQAECRFSYRHSALQETGAVVVKVELVCGRDAPHRIRQAMLADLRERRRKFPRKQPNCGSVFLSTAEMHSSVGPPGQIIEQAGLKGCRIGGAEVSLQHANFIVNLGGATSADVLALIARIRSVVRLKIAFELCCEVRYVNPVGQIMPAHLATSDP